MSTTIEDIRDYIEALIKEARKRPDGFNLIWDRFWEGIKKLHDHGINRPDYYDPDGSCEEDIIACWLAYREIVDDNSDDFQKLIDNPVWKNEEDL